MATIEHLKYVLWDCIKFLILINLDLNSNSQMWLVATILDITDLEDFCHHKRFY